LAESRYGRLPAPDSLFMFLLRSGVNGAFIDSGRVYLTADGTTIETGHVSVSAEGPSCPCGARGCLEAYLTGLDRPNLESGGWLFEGLGPAVAAGDPAAEATLAEAARYLASAAQSVSRLFKPKGFLVVAGSEAIAAALSRLLRARLAEAHSGFDREEPAFTAAVYDPVLAQRGAADLVLDEFLGA
ncbi:MAG: ROK family protein, partial [Spirochaetaceae bacterium]|nr:ROK family protein [Spirochaetaceae bacterium]